MPRPWLATLRQAPEGETLTLTPEQRADMRSWFDRWKARIEPLGAPLAVFGPMLGAQKLFPIVDEAIRDLPPSILSAPIQDLVEWYRELREFRDIP